MPQTELRNFEDPVVWYSGGLYHIVVNNWSQRKASHLTSVDGIKDWKFQGLAYDPTKDFVRYTDGTVNRWHKLERPGVLIENGHVTAVTLAGGAGCCQRPAEGQRRARQQGHRHSV